MSNNISYDKDCQTDDINFYEQAKQYITIYQNNNTNSSSIIDIIGTYVKGQCILYTEAKTLCEQRLSCLMIPSILFTVICSIANLLLKDYVYGNLITSCLNGFIAFILALINYLKLDARSEAHRSSAYKYDKLLSYITFQSGKIYFLKSELGKFRDIIIKIERDISEIKESNQFVLPEKIRYSFPLLSGTNIFTEVKRIESIEVTYLNELSKYMKQEYDYENNKSKSSVEERKQIEEKIEQLNEKKFILTMKIIKLQDEYLVIDKKFVDEINKYQTKNRWRPKCLDYLKV